MTEKITLSVVSGMKDYNPKETQLKNFIIDTFRKSIQKRNVKEIDTPTIELESTIHQLYGDEFNKLVYRVEDTDKLIMRYDLTVPFMRYVAMNGLKSFKRAQVGTVYRKDAPQITKGRLRAFTQADMDILGDDQGSMINDIEIIETVYEILINLGLINEFIFQINHRDVLKDIAEYANINDEKFKIFVQCLDKLDKKSWKEIVSELLENGISIDSIDKIEKIQNYTYDEYKENKIINTKTIEQLDLVFDFCKGRNFKDIIFSPFLARGMDYYTGLIFEIVYKNKDIAPFTICAGGRYDNMLEKFGYLKIPSIGFSIGVDRVLKILESKDKDDIIKSDADVFIASIGKEANLQKMILASEMRELGISVEMSSHINPKMRQQMDIMFKKNIKYMIIIGEDEIKTNTLSLKDIETREQKKMTKKECINFILKNK